MRGIDNHDVNASLGQQFDALFGASTDEIGRASCRERVS
jgi:hypothetical protein